MAALPIPRIRQLMLALSILAAGLGLGSRSASAAPGERVPVDGRSVEREAQAIFNRVLSPYCPGLLLSACTSDAAEKLRDEVRASFRDGESRASVEANLYRRFGDGIRAEPLMRGMGLVVWLAPLLILTASGWWLVGSVRRWSAARHHAPDAPEADALPAFDAALEERLRTELDAL